MKNRILLLDILVIFMIIFSKPQSKALFFTGLFLVIAGEVLRLLSSMAIRKNKELSVRGPYLLCRNPLYLGTSIILSGILIQIVSFNITRDLLIYLITIPSFSYIYYKTIKMEEYFLMKKFTSEYKKYLDEVPSFIPDLTRIKEIFKPENYSKEHFIKNKEYRGVLAVIIIEIIIWIKLNYRL